MNLTRTTRPFRRHARVPGQTTAVNRSLADQLEYAIARSELAQARLAARELEHAELTLLAGRFGVDPAADVQIESVAAAVALARADVEVAEQLLQQAHDDIAWDKASSMLVGV